MLAQSFVQLFKSYSATNTMHTRGYKDWTMRLSFYGSMGGYVLHHRGDTPIPLLMSEIISLLDANPMDGPPYFQLPELSNEYIKSLSRVDEVGKTLAVLQSMWLVASCITRVANGLPISLLEVVTSAYVLCAGGMWACWWAKPLDVRITTRVEYQGEELDETEWTDRSLDSRKKHQGVSVHHSPHKIANSAAEASLLAMLIFGLGFGGIHLAAWNLEFSTPKECIIWRVCSIITTSTLLLIVASVYLQNYSQAGKPLLEAYVERKRSRKQWLAIWTNFLFHLLVMMPYLTSRFILVFLSLYGLRLMPRGVYTSVAWIDYIPHF
jgi:hypothetical protein